MFGVSVVYFFCFVLTYAPNMLNQKWFIYLDTIRHFFYTLNLSATHTNIVENKQTNYWCTIGASSTSSTEGFTVIDVKGGNTQN